MVLTSVRGLSLIEIQPAVQIAGLGCLLDPDRFQDASLPVVGLSVSMTSAASQSGWCLIHAPSMHCNAVLSVVGFDSIFVLRDSLLQGPSRFTYVTGFTFLTRDLVHNSFHLQFWYLGPHFSQYASQGSTGFEDSSNLQLETRNPDIL